MKYPLIAVVTILSTVPAFAADMAMKAPPAPAPAVQMWEGFYIGGYAGGLWDYVHAGRPDTPQVITNNGSGATLGGVIGVNHQWNGLVLGLEGDGGWADVSHTATYISATSGAPETEQDKSSYTAHIRGRVGLPFGQLLPFVAGGVSFTDDKVTLTHTRSALPPDSLSNGWVGWNGGGGVDYAFTPKWIGRVEYIYDNYGAQTYGFNAATAGRFSDRNLKLTESTVRAVLSYKFW
ncbi:MAG TPA: outer membrane beta-barrel protein [Xanthobacteraceae bacterium]|nr:outer membrane beta-barrel protein [Xanthobacteraceae bacterium]